MSTPPPKRGAASELAEMRKSDKYSKLGPHHIFVPTAFETFGIWKKKPIVLSLLLARKSPTVRGKQGHWIFYDNASVLSFNEAMQHRFSGH